MGQKIKAGDNIKISYIGKIKDGVEFEKCDEDSPLVFEVGSEEIIEGLNEAVVGMEVGEKKTVTLGPEEAYGSADPELAGKVKLSELPEGAEVGSTLTDGDDGPNYWVRSIEGEEVVLDGNHPLCGKTLIFDLEIISIDEPNTDSKD